VERNFANRKIIWTVERPVSRAMAILRDKHTFPFGKLAVDRAEAIDLGNTLIHGNSGEKSHSVPLKGMLQNLSVASIGCGISETKTCG